MIAGTPSGPEEAVTDRASIASLMSSLVLGIRSIFISLGVSAKKSCEFKILAPISGSLKAFS